MRTELSLRDYDCAVTPEDEVLLNNVLDSLDRLYDEDCGAFDVEMLIASVLLGLRDPAWHGPLKEAKVGLRAAIIAGGEDRNAVRAAALVATHDLRDKLGEWWTNDKITMWTYDGPALGGAESPFRPDVEERYLVSPRCPRAMAPVLQGALERRPAQATAATSRRHASCRTCIRRAGRPQRA